MFPRALFIRAHKDVQDFPRILPEIPGERVHGTIERASKERWRRERRIIAGYQSREQRAVLATFSDCYYPTGHFIALKRTHRTTAILLLRSLIRAESFLRGKDTEIDREENMRANV